MPLMTVVMRILAVTAIAMVLIAIIIAATTAIITLLMLITLAMRRRPIGRICEHRRRECHRSA
jgi:hypothetical protein